MKGSMGTASNEYAQNHAGKEVMKGNDLSQKDPGRELRDICCQKAYSMYGDPLPDVVKQRLETELCAIISHGYAGKYIMARKWTERFHEEGYLTGFRAAAGSSFVAAMAGIVETNPLSPHYYCPNCHYSDFESEEVRGFAGGCGWDMPDKVCTVCGGPLLKDGFGLPGKLFMGLKKDKEPHFGIEISDDPGCRKKVPRYMEELCGEGKDTQMGRRPSLIVSATAMISWYT